MVHNGTEPVGPVLLRFEASGGSQVSFPSPQFCFLCLKGLLLRVQRLCPFQRLYTLQMTINAAWKWRDDWQSPHLQGQLLEAVCHQVFDE